MRENSKSEKVCSVEGCTHSGWTTGGTATKCPMHYQRERRARAEGASAKAVEAALEAPKRGELGTMKVTSLRMPEDLKARLDAAAKAEGRDASAVVRELVEVWLSKRKT